MMPNLQSALFNLSKSAARHTTLTGGRPLYHSIFPIDLFAHVFPLQVRSTVIQPGRALSMMPIQLPLNPAISTLRI